MHAWVAFLCVRRGGVDMLLVVVAVLGEQLVEQREELAPVKRPRRIRVKEVELSREIGTMHVHMCTCARACSETPTHPRQRSGTVQREIHAYVRAYVHDTCGIIFVHVHVHSTCICVYAHTEQ